MRKPALGTGVKERAGGSLLALAGGLSSLLLEALYPPHTGGLPHRVPVLIIGGSAAAAFVCRPSPSRLGRRWRAGLGTDARFDFHGTSHSMPGAPVVHGSVNQALERWVRHLGPAGMVVLAWGLLNDIRLRVPATRIRRASGSDPDGASRPSVVVLITPPATRSALVQDRANEPRLMALETAARNFIHRVCTWRTFFPKEEPYLRAHGLT